MCQELVAVLFTNLSSSSDHATTFRSFEGVWEASRRPDRVHVGATPAPQEWPQVIPQRLTLKLIGQPQTGGGLRAHKKSYGSMLSSTPIAILNPSLCLQLPDFGTILPCAETLFILVLEWIPNNPSLMICAQTGAIPGAACMAVGFPMSRV